MISGGGLGWESLYGRGAGKPVFAIRAWATTAVRLGDLGAVGARRHRRARRGPGSAGWVRRGRARDELARDRQHFPRGTAGGDGRRTHWGGNSRPWMARFAGGGVLRGFASWRWIFVINLPLVVICVGLDSHRDSREQPPARGERAPRSVVPPVGGCSGALGPRGDRCSPDRASMPGLGRAPAG